MKIESVFGKSTVNRMMTTFYTQMVNGSVFLPLFVARIRSRPVSLLINCIKVDISVYSNLESDKTRTIFEEFFIFAKMFLYCKSE